MMKGIISWVVIICSGVLTCLQFKHLFIYSTTSFISSLSYNGDSPNGDSPRVEKSLDTLTSTKKEGRKVVTTIQGKKGFHLPLDLIEWNLPSPAKLLDDDNDDASLQSRDFTKTICTTGSIPPAMIVKEMFTGVQDWGYISKPKNTADPTCANSRIRVLWERFETSSEKSVQKRRQAIEQHVAGQQLTTQLLDFQVNKEMLEHFLTIQNQTTNRTVLNLKDSLPATRSFESTNSCKNFCDGEWLISQKQPQPQKWIWKPKLAHKGKGIVLVSDKTNADDGASSEESPLESCYQHCTREGGETLQAQAVADTMLLPDGRKFDVRSHILVANLDPLIVFAGAEKIRTCAEPINATNPEPYPGIPANSSWNPFQQVCNNDVGTKHPTPGVWSYESNTGPLEKGIHDEAIRSRVISKIDEHNDAYVELLHQRWTGQVGMFQVLGVDFLVDNSERVWLLEVNDNPGMKSAGETFPNMWGDVFEIQWAILETYNQYRLADGSIDGSWKRALRQRLSTLELDYLRMLR